MEIWFLNQFYPPDRAPTGAMLQVVVERLSAEGHQCVVWCSGGIYAGGGTSDVEGRTADAENWTSDGVRVVRIGKLGAGKAFIAKLRGWLGFYLILAFRLLAARERPDVIVAMTTPPFLSVLARVAAWRHRARHAHWVMDLYPDALAAHGMLDKQSWSYRVLAGLARWGFGGKRAGAVLTIGPCMAERIGRLIHRKDAKDAKERVAGWNGENPPSSIQHPTSLHWIPLWASAVGKGEASDVAAAGQRLRQERGWGAEEVVILYSGNLGRGHVVQPALEAALELARTGRQRLRWVFCAHGARLEEVKRFAAVHPEAGVEFLEPVPADRLAAHLASADVHLASLEASWSGCMVPSKIQGSFGAGRAVLFIGPRSSSPARWIEEAGGGWAVEAAAAARGLPELLAVADLKEEARCRGAAAGAYAARNFDRDTNAGEVARVLIG